MTLFTPKMIEIVKNFSQITNSGIVFPEGDSVSVQDGGGVGVDRSAGRTIVGVGKMETPIETGFALFNAMQFLTALQMFDAPVVEVDPETDKVILRNQSGRSGTFKFNMASPEVVKQPGKIQLPNDSENKTFRLSAEMYGRIFKGISVVNTPEVIIYGQGGELLVAGHDQRDKKSDTFVLPVGDTDQEFSVVVKVDSLNKLLKNVNYDVTIAPAGILQAQSASEEYDVCYFIAGTFQTT